MKGLKAAGHGETNTLTGLATHSRAGTSCRCDEPNQQEGFLHHGRRLREQRPRQQLIPPTLRPRSNRNNQHHRRAAYAPWV
jgi:hypothetical protein